MRKINRGKLAGLKKPSVLEVWGVENMR